MEKSFYRKDYIKLKDEIFFADEVIEKLIPIVTPERLEKLHQVVAKRTYGILPVVEDIYDKGNTNAAMRSAEAYGFFNFHVIEGSGDKFKPANRVSKGTDKWLDIEKHQDTEQAILLLKNRGYQVYCTSLQPNAVAISEIDVTVPTALIFGNEKDGVSAEAIAHSDGSVILPMIGMAQSFNISVAAATAFYHCYQERDRLGKHQFLNNEEQKRVFAMYLMNTVDSWEKIILRN